MRWLIFSVIFVGMTDPVLGQARDGPAYTQIFYKSGALRIEAYLYKPNGPGPFPLIVYNHGSRDGQDAVEQPMVFIGRLLTSAGYAVLVPERRGYGKSDGLILRKEVGGDLGDKLLNRLREEAGDVLAAVDAIKMDPSIDGQRIGVMGWSFGGIAAVLAASHARVFFAVVDQAGGALTWSRSRALQSMLRDAARGITAPTLCLDAENDATTDAVRAVCETVRTSGASTELKIYPPFMPTQNVNNVAPGHLIFSAQGIMAWGRDVVAFFGAHLPQ